MSHNCASIQLGNRLYHSPREKRRMPYNRDVSPATQRRAGGRRFVRWSPAKVTCMALRQAVNLVRHAHAPIWPAPPKSLHAKDSRLLSLSVMDTSTMSFLPSLYSPRSSLFLERRRLWAVYQRNHALDTSKTISRTSLINPENLRLEIPDRHA